MHQKFFKRAVELGTKMGWEVVVIDFESKGVMYRIYGPYRSPHNIRVNRVFFESLEATMRDR